MAASTSIVQVRMNTEMKKATEQMLKSMGCKVIAHYHNKGVSVYQSKWVYNFFYKRFFSNLKVILLAENLYKDIAKYVKREDVYNMVLG